MPNNIKIHSEDEELQKKYRHALSNFATGITLVTSMDYDNKPFAITINSFTSVSLNPSIIAWSLGQNNRYKDYFYNKPYLIQILSAEQLAVAQQFSKTALSQKFDERLFDWGDNHIPILNGCLAYFECIPFDAIEVGDHTLFLGRVRNFFVDNNANTGSALVFFKKQMLNLDAP